MRKLVAIIMVLSLFVATGALADNWVNWRVDTGYYDNDLTPDPLDYYGDVGIGNSVLWLLVYSSGGSYGTATASDLGGGNAQVNLSDLIVGYRFFDAPGWANQGDTEEADLGGASGLGFDAGMYTMSGNTTDDTYKYTGARIGSVYQAVFQGVSFNGTQITFSGDGIYYTFDALTTLDNIVPDGTTPPQTCLGAEGAAVRVDNYLEGYPAVPEPATMSLLGLGALVMAIRRRRS